MTVIFEKYISKTREAKAFKGAFEYFFTLIEDKVQELGNNLFTKTLNLEFIKAWERFFEISEDNSLTLEQRRQQIALYKVTKPPFTLNTITAQIRVFTQLETDVRIDLSNLVLLVEADGITPFTLNLIKTYLSLTKPTNVIFKLGKFIDTTPTEYYACATTQATIYDLDAKEVSKKVERYTKPFLYKFEIVSDEIDTTIMYRHDENHPIIFSQQKGYAYWKDGGKFYEAILISHTEDIWTNHATYYYIYELVSDNVVNVNAIPDTDASVGYYYFDGDGTFENPRGIYRVYES